MRLFKKKRLFPPRSCCQEPKQNTCKQSLAYPNAHKNYRISFWPSFLKTARDAKSEEYNPNDDVTKGKTPKHSDNLCWNLALHVSKRKNENAAIFDQRPATFAPSERLSEEWGYSSGCVHKWFAYRVNQGLWPQKTASWLHTSYVKSYPETIGWGTR